MHREFGTTRSRKSCWRPSSRCIPWTIAFSPIAALTATSMPCWSSMSMTFSSPIAPALTSTLWRRCSNGVPSTMWPRRSPASTEEKKSSVWEIRRETKWSRFPRRTLWRTSRMARFERADCQPRTFWTQKSGPRWEVLQGVCNGSADNADWISLQLHQ